MQSVKETAANIAASAKSGLDKTKAVVQEKAEKMSTRDPVQKEMATQKKEEMMEQAELNKQQAREQNAAARQAASAGGTQSYTPTTGAPGYSTGTHELSAMPGQVPTGHVTQGGGGGGGLGSQYPVGTNTGTGRTRVDP